MAAFDSQLQVVPRRRVAVLLATHNGARFLDAQIESVLAQDVDATIDIHASDDASTDGTAALLESWRGRWTRGCFESVPGPVQGFAENFRALLQRPLSDPDYVAFCDQDDIWDTDKLRVAIDALAPAGDRPGLYCGRTRLVDLDGTDMGFSPHFLRPPTFRNAIVQSLAGGNTMVLNRAAHALVAASARRAGFVSHDWWSYQIVTGAGGLVIYDAVPHIRYRQHEGNLVGNNMGLLAKARRLRMTLEGRFSGWNDINLAALDQCADLLTPEARATVEAFAALRRKPPTSRLMALLRTGIHRQTVSGDISLWVAALIGKL